MYSERLLLGDTENMRVNFSHTLRLRRELCGISAGVIGFVVNFIVFVGGSYATGGTEETERARAILEYNSVEYPNGSDGDGVKYVLPGQKKSFWVGLVIVLALMVPWYAPESWNVEAVLRASHLDVVISVYWSLRCCSSSTEPSFGGKND